MDTFQSRKNVLFSIVKNKNDKLNVCLNGKKQDWCKILNNSRFNKNFYYDINCK